MAHSRKKKKTISFPPNRNLVLECKSLYDEVVDQNLQESICVGILLCLGRNVCLVELFHIKWVCIMGGLTVEHAFERCFCHPPRGATSRVLKVTEESMTKTDCLKTNRQKYVMIILPMSDASHMFRMCATGYNLKHPYETKHSRHFFIALNSSLMAEH